MRIRYLFGILLASAFAAGSVPLPSTLICLPSAAFRGADLSIVWLEILAAAAIGAVYFAFALRRFRSVIFGG